MTEIETIERLIAALASVAALDRDTELDFELELRVAYPTAQHFGGKLEVFDQSARRWCTREIKIGPRAFVVLYADLPEVAS